MYLNNKKIAFALAYNCPYGGNLIPSLELLAEKLQKYNCTIFWIFPKQQDYEWIVKLKKSYQVFFIDAPYKKATDELYYILKENDIDLIHSHFEAYDESIAKACKRSKREIKQVWHVHDHLGYSGSLVNKLKCHFSYFRHYYIYGKDVHLIPVSEEMAAFCEHYRKGLFFFPAKKFNIKQEKGIYHKSTTLINGILLSRIQVPSEIVIPYSPFIFLSYGGQSKRKRIDLLVKAGQILTDKGYNIKIVITSGTDTKPLIKKTLGHLNFDWLEIINQTEDVNTLLKSCSCYVSTSQRETMSMAIAEATLAGKPVIQSDIAGTWWNASNPSTYLFQNKNIDDLARQMEILINTPNAQIIKNCQITQANNLKLLNLDLWCNKIISIYKKI